MDDEVYEKYLLAGKIAAEARDYGKTLIRPGVSFLKVAEFVESKILSKNAGIAFPVNLSINDVAAHFTPRHDDKIVFKKGDVVKLDVGAHIDGYIADTALTVEVGTDNHGDMICASSDALDVAIDNMKAGVDLSKIGGKIEETIKSYGYKSVANLSGHKLDYYALHSGLEVPNVKSSAKILSTEYDVLAVEPFATDGRGHISSGSSSNIYIYNKSFNERLIRDRQSKILINKIKSNFKTLPFAQRWCKKIINKGFDQILRRLTLRKVITSYPKLIEVKGSIVTQKEHTVIIHEDDCEVTTL